MLCAGHRQRRVAVEVPVQGTKVAAQHAAAMRCTALCSRRTVRQGALSASEAQDRCAMLVSQLVRVAIFCKSLPTELYRPLRNGVHIHTIRPCSDALVVCANVVGKSKYARVLCVKVLEEHTKGSIPLRRTSR